MDKTGGQLLIVYFILFVILSPWSTNEVLGSIVQENPYYEIVKYGLEILENKCSTKNDSEVESQRIDNCAASLFGAEKFEKSESIPDVSIIVEEICQPVEKSTKSTCMVDHRQIIESCPKPETQDFNQILMKVCEVGLEEPNQKSLLHRFFQKSGLECLNKISRYVHDCTLLARTSYIQNPQIYNNENNCEFIKKSLDCLHSGFYISENVELIEIMAEVRDFMKSSLNTSSPNCYLSGAKYLQCCAAISECNPLENCRAAAGCCSIPNCDPRDECDSLNATTPCCPEGPGCNPTPNCNPAHGCCKDMRNCNSDPKCINLVTAGAWALDADPLKWFLYWAFFFSICQNMSCYIFQSEK